MLETPSFAVILESELGSFLVELQTSRRLDAEAFERISRLLDDAAVCLQHESKVSKGFLWDIRSAIKTLRAEAPYLGDAGNQATTMSDCLEMIFDLILLGETRNDRVSGVPRIL